MHAQEDCESQLNAYSQVGCPAKLLQFALTLNSSGLRCCSFQSTATGTTMDWTVLETSHAWGHSWATRAKSERFCRSRRLCCLCSEHLAPISNPHIGPRVCFQPSYRVPTSYSALSCLSSPCFSRRRRLRPHRLPKPPLPRPPTAGLLTMRWPSRRGDWPLGKSPARNSTRLSLG